MDDEENSQERYAMMPPYSLPAADGETPEEGDTVRSGAVRDPAVPVSSEDEVVEALRTVFDPEIPVNVYDLGLIYDLKVAESGDVDIMMTLTAPACPVAGILPQEVADAAANLAGVGKVAVTITWDPAWTPENMSEVAKVALDMF